MRSWSSRLLAFAFVASAALASVAARAQPAGAAAPAGPRDVAGAEALFNDGKRLMDAGQVAEACPKFEESMRLDPGVGALLNLADCREKEGKLATAWAHYRDAEAQLKAASDERRAAFARERASALEPRLPMVIISVDAPPDGLVVSRDGIELSAASLGTRLPVDPGEHKVVAAAPGRITREQTVLAKEHELTQVSIPQLDVAPEPLVAISPEQATPSQGSSAGNTRRTVALVVGGVGIVSMVAGLVFVGATAAQKSAADHNCPTETTCTAAGFDAVATAKDLALAADITIIGGAVLTGAGVVLYVTAPSDAKSAPSSAVWIAPSLSPLDLGVRATAAF